MTAHEVPPAPAGAPEPKKKARGIIRWGVLIVLIVVSLGFAFFGAGPLARWAIEKYGSKAAGAPVKVASASFNVFKMALTLTDLRVLGPAAAEAAAKAGEAEAREKDQFSAAEARAKLDPLALLKGQVVVDELALVKPRGRLVRHADGSINTGPPPESPPPGTAPDDPAWKKKLEEQARKRDLVEDARNLLRKLKERRDEAVAKEEVEARRRAEQGVRDYKGRAEYVRAGGRPRLVIRRLLADGLEVRIEDEASGAPPETITGATLEVKEWSTSPAHHDKPMEVHFDGKLAGAPTSDLKLDGLLDFTSALVTSKIDAHLANLPLATLDAFYRKAIPVEFVGKTLGSVDLPLEFKGWEIDWKPAILLDQIEARAREPGQKIAGFEASRVAQELTNAGKLLLRDIRVHGPIWAPSIEGDVETVKSLVLEGGKNYALKQARAHADKLLEKSPEAKKVLEKTGAEDLLKGATEKGAGEAAKDAAEKVIDIFKRE